MRNFARGTTLASNAIPGAAVRAVIKQFPLYHYLHGVEIDELSILDSVATRFPHISLN